LILYRHVLSIIPARSLAKSNVAFQPIENPSDSAVEFARRRLQLGENLYYKMLEKILVSEQQRISVTAGAGSKTVDFSVGF